MAVPTVGQTPTEIIDLVLIELREDRSSSDNPAAGVETLMRFSGPGSSIHMGGKVSARESVRACVPNRSGACHSPSSPCCPPARAGDATDASRLLPRVQI